MTIITITDLNIKLDTSLSNPTLTPGSGVTYPSNYSNMPAATIDQIFSENYYMTTYGTQVASFMQADPTIKRGYDHWVKYGITAGYSPNAYYTESTYLSNNPDVKKYVKGQPVVTGATQYFNSGLEHWLLYGRVEAVAANNLTVAATRTKTATPGSFPFTSGVDNLVADANIGGNFTGTDAQVQAGDIADGGNASLSTLTLTLGGNTGAATIKNIGTINATGTGAARTIDFTNITGVTNLNSVSTTGGALTATNVAINPTLGITSSNQGMTVTYLDSVLTGNAGTVNIALNDVTNSAASIIELDYTASGYFKTINIASNGTVTNALWNHATVFTSATDGLKGTALHGASVLNVTGLAPFQTSIDSGITTIRTITAAPATTIAFNDATTATAGNLLTATFNTAGSRLMFNSGITLPTTGNKVTFTGSNNTLAMIHTTANGVSSSVASQFTGLDTLEITDGLAASNIVNVSLFGNNITTVNVDATLGGNASITSLNNNVTVNFGLSTGAILATTNTLTLATAVDNPVDVININALGNAGAGVTQTIVANGFGTINYNISSYATSGTLVPAISSDIASKVVVTGGAVGQTLNPGTLTGNIATYDASGYLGIINSITAANIPTTIKGSLTAANTINGGTALDTLIGGAGNDSFNGYDGANFYTGHAVAGGTDTNTYTFTKVTAINTITDFNFGTSTTGVDKIVLKAVPTGMVNSTSNLAKGSGATDAATDAPVVQSFSATVSLAATSNILVYTGAATTAAGLQTAVQTGGSAIITFTGAQTANYGIPVFYVNSADGFVHGAIIKATDTGATSANNQVTDFLVLQGVTSVANIDATDFGAFA